MTFFAGSLGGGRLQAVQRHVESFEIAGPGFINLRLRASARQAVVREVLAAKEQFGFQADNGQRVLVEFVSANPTGPLHVGHGRQAALGDAICNLFATQGFNVYREFYYNDAGVQINTLAKSTHFRAQGIKPGDASWPVDPENPESKAFYNGDYIQDIATDFLAGKTVKSDDREFTASGDVNDVDGMREFAVAYLRREQDLDLKAFEVKFDHYYLESSLYTDGRVDRAVASLQASGHTYEQDGALWLRSTDFGDEKDRVVQRDNGLYTYFASDIAYHLNKYERGFDRMINIWGADHHGYIPRVKGAVQALALDPAKLDIALVQFAVLYRNGEKASMSTRSGDYVTLRSLRAEVGDDACRFFYVLRKADQHLDFDLDLAKSQSADNPVYYIQYAHARICSLMAQWNGVEADLKDADLALLTNPREAALTAFLGRFPEVIDSAARDLAPHQVAFYLRDLAAEFHGYYNAERMLLDDAELTCARLALSVAVRQVIRNGMALLGVSCPESM